MSNALPSKVTPSPAAAAAGGEDFASGTAVHRTASEAAANARIERRAAVIAAGVAVALLLMKLAAYGLTGSAAVLADALETTVNVAAAAFAVYALALAHRPADPTHPYGHGKIEFFSAGFEGGMILVAGAVAALYGAKNLWFNTEGHHAVSHVNIAILLLAVALAANSVTGLWLIRLGRRRASLTLEADGRHLISDAVTSAAALAALGLVRLTHVAWIDPLVAVAAGIYISLAGVALLRRSIAGLMDRQDVADDVLLRGILQAHVGPDAREPRICSYHKLRHRHSGRYHWVDFHVRVPATWNVKRGHEAASAIEHEIELTLGEGNATAHVEPCNETGCDAC